MKKYCCISFLILTCFFSCVKDKGNYNYVDLGEMRVEGLPKEIEVLAFLDSIKVSPKFISSKEGEINAENPNYSIQYRIGYKGMGVLVVDGEARVWADITPAKGFALSAPTNFSPGTYICWLTLTDKRNKTVNSMYFDVKVSSTTSEGWMILCNEGPQERVRLDMISYLSSTRTSPIFDIASGLPQLHHAKQLGFHTQKYQPDIIRIFSDEGSYELDSETLTSNASSEFNAINFLRPPQSETMIATASMSATNDPDWMTKFCFVFSDLGNVYNKIDGRAGAMFGLPINTLVSGTPVQFKVAPFVGFSPARPANSRVALFYDESNKCFLGFNGGEEASAGALVPLKDPDDKLFSFKTGKDMIYMESTRRSNGLVYAILQDAGGKRSIYGINMAGNGFSQESYFQNINAPQFSQATQFAFHSKYPFLFYAVKNRIYLYNLSTNMTKEMTNISLGETEEVTCLKFNLYRNSDLTSLNKQTDAFMDQQFQLIVGSYNNKIMDGNGGKVSFYQVDGSNSISLLHDYSGFAKVKDVVYRER